EDRHGVRHSIIGRITRVGGRADIRPRATGTEVHLSVPRSPCPSGAGGGGGGGGGEAEESAAENTTPPAQPLSQSVPPVPPVPPMPQPPEER
ncbi:MAG: hypothetical protein ACTJGR_07190, partial [Pauljensenia sp.]